MQAIVGAEHFAVLRVSGYGLPSARKLTVFLHNWARDADGNAGVLLDAYGAAMLSPISKHPCCRCSGKGRATASSSNRPPDPSPRAPARLLPWSGMAFPVRLGTHGNGYVLFMGAFTAPSSDLIVDMHMKSCQMFVDMLAGEQKKPTPAQSLSDRELACLQMAGDGCISEAIAEKMGLSVHTVNAYLGTATTKLDAVNRIQAIAKAIRFGYIT